MRLLFLANRIPYPPFRGDKLKIFNLARRLAPAHTLHLIAFTETADDAKYEAPLKEVFREVTLIHQPRWKAVLHTAAALWDRRPLQVLYFRSGAMQRAVDAALNNHRYDAVHVQHLRMAPYLADHPEVPRILDLPDAFSLYWSRRAALSGGYKATLARHESARLRRFEEESARHFNLTLACSTDDLAYLRKAAPGAAFGLLPNGVDLSRFSTSAHDYNATGSLLFSGNMDYAPNVDAAVHLAEDILPQIQAGAPGTRLIIAGQRPVPRVQALAALPGVEVTGFVENWADVYRRAAVVVAPMRFGAGTQNKILEGLAAGVPVVTYPLGFQGLGIGAEDGVVVAEDANRFAAETVRLLTNESLRRKTGMRARAVAIERFGWDAIAGQLEGYFEAVARGDHPAE